MKGGRRMSRQNPKKLTEETMDLSEYDYKNAIMTLYRRINSEFSQLNNSYSSWVQECRIYALAKSDGQGHPIYKNMEAYNNAMKERKKTAIMLKIIRDEIKMMEKYWVDKGYSLCELQKSIQTKELYKAYTQSKDFCNKDDKVMAENKDKNTKKKENNDDKNKD